MPLPCISHRAATLSFQTRRQAGESVLLEGQRANRRVVSVFCGLGRWRKAVFFTPGTGLAQNSSATAYGNQYVHTAESRYPEAGIGGGSDQCFKLSYTWVNTR